MFNISIKEAFVNNIVYNLISTNSRVLYWVSEYFISVWSRVSEFWKKFSDFTSLLTTHYNENTPNYNFIPYLKNLSFNILIIKKIVVLCNFMRGINKKDCIFVPF